MTDQEINEAVARKLGFGEWIDQSVLSGGNLDWSPKDYCHSIAAAWEIAKSRPMHGDLHFQLRFYFSGYKDGIGYGPVWWAGWAGSHYRGGDSDDTVSSTADTAPMAIVQAFLKLPEGKKPDRFMDDINNLKNQGCY